MEKKRGRPNTGVKRKSVCFSCSPENEKLIRKLASENKKTLSQFIIDSCLHGKENERTQRY